MYKCHPIFLSWGKGWVELAVPMWRSLLPLPGPPSNYWRAAPGPWAGSRPTPGQRPSGGRGWHLLLPRHRGSVNGCMLGAGRVRQRPIHSSLSFTKQESKLQNKINVNKLHQPCNDKTNKKRKHQDGVLLSSGTLGRPARAFSCVQTRRPSQVAAGPQGRQS